MSIAGADGLILVQFDIKTAYLNSTIREIIFMDLPFGFEECFHKHFPENCGKVCRILNGLYGLKQSTCNWNSTFFAFLKGYDLLQSTTDPCIFFSTTTPRLILALWVDDGLAMCQDQALLTKMIAHLQTAFEITVGDADVYVGIHITRDVAARWIYIDQQRFTETIIVKYGFQDAHTVSTPCDPHVPLSHSHAGYIDIPIPHFPYQEIVGSLLYLATHSRPDIAHAVSVVAHMLTNFEKFIVLLSKGFSSTYGVLQILLFVTRGILMNLVCLQPSLMLTMLVTLMIARVGVAIFFFSTMGL